MWPHFDQSRSADDEVLITVAVKVHDYAGLPLHTPLEVRLAEVLTGKRRPWCSDRRKPGIVNRFQRLEPMPLHEQNAGVHFGLLCWAGGTKNVATGTIQKGLNK